MSIVFTVAIPSYNRENLLKLNLDITIKQVLSSEIKGEILVIDDFSNDETIKLLKEYKALYPENFRYFTHNINRGIAKTRNHLVKEAKGKYIIFIDSDVIPSQNLIKNHLESLLSEKNIICQGSLILSSNLENISAKKFNPFTDFSRAYFDTANVSVEKEKIIAAGYFDENFTGYGWEDLELGIRLKKSGLKIVRNKKAYAYHYQPGLSLDDMDKLIIKEKERARGAVYFAKKHPSFEVKLMTQITSFHLQLDKMLEKITNTKFFLNYLYKLEQKKDYNKLIPLYRLYLNHFNILELKKIINKP